jgi:N-acetylmuramoyl-L-alanine amidase
MSITNHFIDGIAKKTLNHQGANQTPTLLVIHYSVTNTVQQAVNALNSAGLSYHILIEKNGKAFQTRRFTETALHPGLSNWKAESGVTLSASVGRGSVGICLMNKGFDPDSGSPRKAGKLIYNPNDPQMQEWEVFPDEQIEACTAIAKDIIATYPISDVVGHNDVAILGKFDPGPLFNLNALDRLTTAPKLLGFKTTVKANDGLNLRREARANGPLIKNLPKGTEVFIRSIVYGPRAECIQPNPPSKKRYLTKWASVDTDGSNKHAGFVHLSGLRSTPLSPSLAAHL